MNILESFHNFITRGAVQENAALREDAADARMTNYHLREAIAELESTLNYEGWQIVTGAESRSQFSSEALKKIRRLGLLMYLKNPLIRRGVEVQADYVFGQGVTVHSKDDAANVVIQELWNNARNRKEFTDASALQDKEREQQINGEHFFALFTNTVYGTVEVGTIDPDEICGDPICSPDDDKEPWFYKRVWNAAELDFETGAMRSKTLTAYYPDINYNPAKKPRTIGGHTIKWDVPIYHVKTGGTSRMKRGLCEYYSAIDWARAYAEFLENRATVAKALARFVHKAKAKTKAGVAAVKKKVSTTLARPGAETNPPPVAGSIAVVGEGRDIEPMSVKGATINPDEGRRLSLMAFAGQGLPETFYGDASVGSLATAESLDWPTALAMMERQKFWATVFKNIATYALIKAARAAANPFKATVVYKGKTPQLLGADGKEIPIDVDFPPIIKDNVKDRVDSIDKAAKYIPSDREVCRMQLVALRVDEIDTKLDEMFNEDGTAKNPRPQPSTQPGAPAPQDEESQAKKKAA